MKWTRPGNVYSVAFALLAVALVNTSAKGSTVLYSDLGPGGTFYTGLGGYGVDGESTALAMPFVPGSTATLADAILAVAWNGGPDDAAMNVYLESDAGGVPGSILATLTESGVPAALIGALSTFTCASCPTLTTGTTYWIVAQQADVNSDDSWYWNYNLSTGPIAFDLNGSATGPWIPSNNYLAAFEVDGFQPASEPAYWMLLGVGGLFWAAGMFRRARRRTQEAGQIQGAVFLK